MIEIFPKLQMQTKFNYHFHVHFRLLECAGRLSEADLMANPGYGYGSIHQILSHVVRADRYLRTGLETGLQPAHLPPDYFPTLEALVEGSKEEEKAWQDYLGSLTSEDITAEYSLTSRRGETSILPRWQMMEHVIYHGMQHHSELAQLLTLKGQSPGNIDFLFFIK
ncbi:MAG TPA: DinB family protein [Anaerolineaceae bacterium]|nr:DinB family protein [Anaerolineaceae bacterium]HPN54140.1 DinB family protein [Anaerolineaceae bacterium]